MEERVKNSIIRYAMVLSTPIFKAVKMGAKTNTQNQSDRQEIKTVLIDHTISLINLLVPLALFCLKASVGQEMTSLFSMTLIVRKIF